MPSIVVATIGGVTRDYTTIAAWEAATDNDLVSADQIQAGELYDDADFTQTSQLGFAGATVDATRYRILRAASGQEFDPLDGSGVRILNAITDANKKVFRIAEDYFRMSDFAIDIQTSAGSNPGCLFIANNTNDAWVDSLTMYVRKTSTSTYLVDMHSGSSACVLSNLIGSIKDSGVLPLGLDLAGSSNKVLNCAIYGSTGTGLQTQSGSSWTLRNCIVLGSSTADYDFNGTEDENYCMASDTTLGGASSIESATAAAVWSDAASGDFRLKSRSAAIDAGESQSATITGSFEPGVNHATDTGTWNMGPYDGSRGVTHGAYAVAIRNRALAHNLTR